MTTQEIRELPADDRYDETVHQLGKAEETSASDAVMVTYRVPKSSGLPCTEPLIPMGISETRGDWGHQLLVREPDDPEHQLFTIPLGRLVRIEPAP
ncbi:MAG: hypothetical protein LC792_00030 [Actinobacteria bacterium]|nr:hypothetical protein [Actinomycetota bacterium]